METNLAMDYQSLRENHAEQQNLTLTIRRRFKRTTFAKLVSRPDRRRYQLAYFSAQLSVVAGR